MEKRIEGILIDAMQTRPGWMCADCLMLAPLAQVSEVELERAMARAGAECWNELKDEFDQLISEGSYQVKDLNPGGERCELVIYIDGSVGNINNCESESWSSIDEAVSDLRNRMGLEEWEAEGFAEFFGENV